MYQEENNLKPAIVLKSMQFTEKSKNKVYGWVLGMKHCNGIPRTESNGDHTLDVQTESNLFKLNIGDWLVLDHKGLLHKLSDEEFKSKYSKVQNR